MVSLYLKVLSFKTKYPLTIGWRLSSHCRVIESHINPDEKVLYAFVAQKNESALDILNTCVVALTDKRLLIGHKRLLFGYFFYSITPDMFNDLQVKMGIIWGKVYIDTIRELVILSNISRRALIEIETKVSAYMMEQKKLYPLRSKANE
ncbi:MAG: PH domain-containing protein [Bacilli bacterium]|nr:PH domain-containing protein [Bacilli bacterium]MDD4298451.1 PH domain-containing protein [Bacilli bacterium]MDD4643636.1 PH domain-containing protein [Bacilli bacterium]